MKWSSCGLLFISRAPAHESHSEGNQKLYGNKLYPFSLDPAVAGWDSEIQKNLQPMTAVEDHYALATVRDTAYLH